MSKYMIRVAGVSPARGAGVYDGGNTIAAARKEGKILLGYTRLHPNAEVSIVKSAPYHKTKNPHEEQLLIVESIQSPPIGGFRRDTSQRRSPDLPSRRKFPDLRENKTDYVLVYGGSGAKGFAVSLPYVLKSMAIDEAKALSRPNSYGDEVRVAMRKDGHVIEIGRAKNGVYKQS